jgi:hypothetical protein
VPFAAIEGVVREVGSVVEGKVLIDVTNALDANMGLAVGFTTSGAEELQRKVPKARVVKAFNTVFAQHMDSGRLGDTPLTAFVAGDDARRQGPAFWSSRVRSGSTRWTPVRSRTLASSSPSQLFNIQLGYVLGMGTQIGFKLLQDRDRGRCLDFHALSMSARWAITVHHEPAQTLVRVALEADVDRSRGRRHELRIGGVGRRRPVLADLNPRERMAWGKGRKD